MDNKHGAWFWCLHCERAFWVSDDEIDTDEKQNEISCSYDECDGFGIGRDIRSWKEIKAGHSDYPLIPVVGKEYPLFGD